jgi:hypothetical protein
MRKIVVLNQPRQIVHKTLKNPSQKGLAEWLKVKALSSSPSMTKRKEKNKTEKALGFRGFCAWLVGLIALGLWQQSTSRQGECDRTKLLTSWWPGSREKRRGQGPSVPLGTIEARPQWQTSSS